MQCWALPRKPLSKLSEEKLTQLLNAAGEARVLRKLERFHAPIIIEGYEQTFHRGVAEALGYPNNKQPFQILADTLPLTTLRDLVPAKFKGEERALHYQALLFGASGLIDSENWKEIPDLRKLVTILESYKNALPDSPLTKKDWCFRAIRPANYPYRRIAGLAYLVVLHEKKGLFANFIQAISTLKSKNASQKEVDKLLNFFCLDATDYWSQHYTPGGKTLAASQQLICTARSREIIINIGLPIGLVFARAGKLGDLEERLNYIFQITKGASDNKLIRFMKHYIFGDQKEMLRLLSSEKQVQGTDAGLSGFLHSEQE